MFGLSPSEMLIVGVVAVLLFGSRLPSVARSFGKSVTEFRRGMNDLQHEFRDAMREADEVAREPATGTQGRLTNSAAAVHNDDGQGYDDSEPEPVTEEGDEVDVVADRQESDEAAKAAAEG